MIKFIDLFAGVGGFHYGLVNASASSRKQQGLSEESSGSTSNNLSEMALQQFTCVYSNEWDKYANSVYKKHFGQCDDRDIRQVDAGEIPDFDLLCGGFPCQSFSVAGRRAGFEDTRGTLFFEIARIVRKKQPRLLFLENVKGLLNHDEGRTFGVILATLDELGYDLQWQVLNSKDFGVPQNRERVYIVGHLRGTPRPQVFPLTRKISQNTPASDAEQQGSQKFIKTRHLSQNGSLISNSTTLQATEVPHTIDVGTLRTHKDGEGFRKMKGNIAPTIPARARNDGSGQPVILSKTVRSGGLNSPHGSKQNWDSYEVDGVIRRLTPIECERLQGFPDNWTRLGVQEKTSGLRVVEQAGRFGFGCGITNFEEVLISDTQRYKMMGNAVTTNVITAIGEAIIQSLTTLE